MSENRYNAPAAMKRIPLPKLEDKALERYLMDFAREIHSAMSSLSGSTNTIGQGVAGGFSGPASAVGDDIALFDGTSGNILKDSGMKIDTGAVAGTVPVRDANGKLPGDITGDAATIGGVGLSKIPYLGQTPTTNKLGSVFTGDADNIVAEGIYINNNNSITNIPSGAAYGWLIHHQWSTAAAAYQVYIRQSSVRTIFHRTKVADVWQNWVQLTDNNGRPYMDDIEILELNGGGTGDRNSLIDFHNSDSPADYTGRIGMVSGGLNMTYLCNNTNGYHSFNQYATASRGFKKAITSVAWSISLTTGKEFFIHQAVNVSFNATSTVIAAYANGAWRNIHADVADSTTNRSYSLAEGRYRNINSGTIIMYIGHAPSNVQGEIISLL